MPASSTAVVFEGPERPLQLRSFATPVPSTVEILARVLGCTLCGSDLHSLDGRRSVPLPTILGHEIVGRIEAFGPDAPRRDLAGQPLEVGDRVTWSVAASCGDCFFCRRDLPQKCESLLKYGHEAIGPGRELTGGLAEHCLLVRGTAVVRLPESMPLAVCCPAGCATATIAAAIEAAGPLRNARVLVVGAGMLGVTACAMSRAQGAAEVICLDIDTERRGVASRFGATRLAGPDELAEAVGASTEGRGADVVLELSGSPDAFDSVLPQARLGGRIVLVGSVFPARPVSLALDQVVRRNLSLVGIHNYAPRHLRAAVEFLDEQQAYPFESLVTRWVSLNELPDAWAAGRASGCLRLGVRIGE